LLLAAGIGAAASKPDSAAKWLSTITLVRFANFLTPISPAWTLFHEVAFYAVFALLILTRRLGIAVFIAWQVACLTLFQYPHPDQRTPFAVYFAAYNLDFAIGMLTCYLFSCRLSGLGRLRAPLFWLAGGLALLAETLLREAADPAWSVYPLFYALAFGAIILGAALWEADRPRLRLPILPFLGDASYSIYLTHEAFEGLFLKIVTRTHLTMPGQDLVLYAAILLATVVAGCAAHLVIERPVLTLTRRGFDHLHRCWPAFPGGERRDANEGNT
jgi:exopolysaccharide production protein ExoZ